nr:unnamed protein product [Digitaria exilis]
MKKYSSGPIIDVPVDVQSNKKISRTPLPSKSLSDSDMPEFAKLVKSCSHGMVKLVDLLHERFPCISKAQLKNKVREIAEFTHNRWQVKEDILDQYSLCLSPDKSGSSNCATSHLPQQCQPPDESSKAGKSSPHSSLKPDVSRQHIGAQGSSGSAPHPDP